MINGKYCALIDCSRFASGFTRIGIHRSGGRAIRLGDGLRRGFMPRAVGHRRFK